MVFAEGAWAKFKSEGAKALEDLMHLGICLSFKDNIQLVGLAVWILEIKICAISIWIGAGVGGRC